MQSTAFGGFYDQALSLFDSGYIPLPLRKNSKHLDMERLGYKPLHLVTQRKNLKELMFDSACLHLSQLPPQKNDVARWFQDFDGNIGILGGYKGLVILDFDRLEIFETWRQKHQILVARAPYIRSPKGWHIFLRCDEPLITSSLYFGFRKAGHLKSLGGYVVTAPSVLHTNGRYECTSLPLHEQEPPPLINAVSDLGLSQSSPFKIIYDKALKRGRFIPE